uniref:ARAD1D23276p n=1 Tax=Blastobotrys adeninivorans TaxID=409370 RepID=A0A060TAE1_BLAAD
MHAWWLTSALLAVTANAVSVKGSLSASILPLTPEEHASTYVELTRKGPRGPEVDHAYLRDNGQFETPDLREGSYLLELRSVALSAPESYRIDVINDTVQAYKVFPGHDYLADPGPIVSVPLVISPVGRPTYLIPREQFSLFSMLSNPMMLMSLAALAMVFIIPKLSENIDPEVLKEAQMQQQQQQQVQQTQQASGPRTQVVSSGTTNSGASSKKSNPRKRR